MVLLCGVPNDSPLQLLIEALEKAECPYVFVNQRHFDQMAIRYEWIGGELLGELTIDREIYELQYITGIYNRGMNYQALPEYQRLAPDDPLRTQAARFHDGLFGWIEMATCRVLNRTYAMSSNSSKPYQMLQIVKAGFGIPPSLMTNQPETVPAYQADRGTLIFKSASGVRSIVRELADEHTERLEQVKSCPALFQQKLVGTNIRVHVVGNQVFAHRIESGYVDYRYASRNGSSTEMTAYDLPASIVDRCIRLTERLNLPLAGIDLFETEAGDYYCFEVNPSPGFSYFEEHTGQQISVAIAEYLYGGFAIRLEKS
jgi:hypothetical protein